MYHKICLNRARTIRLPDFQIFTINQDYKQSYHITTNWNKPIKIFYLDPKGNKTEFCLKPRPKSNARNGKKFLDFPQHIKTKIQNLNMPTWNLSKLGRTQMRTHLKEHKIHHQQESWSSTPRRSKLRICNVASSTICTMILLALFMWFRYNYTHLNTR